MKPLVRRPARGIGVARFFGALGLAVAIEAALARRFDVIDSLTLLAAMAAVLAMALIALVAVLVAFRDIWREGVPGFGSAFFAFVVAGLTLAPFAGAAASVIVYPPIDEISTDLADRPVFHARPESQRLPFVAVAPESEHARLQAETYPDLVPRSLPLSTVEAHAMAHLAATELGWTLVVESEPASEADGGSLDAVARSLLLGLPNDVAVRVTPEANGSRIDVRSASRIAMPDLGENARRIRAFFAKIDEIMTRPAGG
jgi:hypothetical protein